MPPKFLEHIVILCFEKRFSKQNRVIRLKSNILATPKFLTTPKFLGWLRHWVVLHTKQMHYLSLLSEIDNELQDGIGLAIVGPFLQKAA